MSHQAVETIPDAASLLDEGIAQARAIVDPIARGRHLAAWVQRLSLSDPDQAAALVSDIPPEEPYLRAEAMLAVTTDRLRRGDRHLESDFGRTLEFARESDVETRLRVINALCEVAIDLSERDRDAAGALLRRLVPEARALTVPDLEAQQPRALASALLGEALLVMDDPLGRELLDEAVRLAEGLHTRDPLVSFVASALAERDPERAAELAGTLQDPAGRLELRLQLLDRLPETLRERVTEAAEADAVQVEHMRGPEAFVRLGAAVASFDRQRAAAAFDRALAQAEAGGAQLRSLQYTGVAAAVARADREWARELFQQAIDAAMEEDERVRRVTALVVVANEMAESHPREAAEIFARAMEEGSRLEALWELAHGLDLVFRGDRSEFLDIRPARPLLERAFELLSGEDLHLPGTFGLPDLARCMLQVDPERGVQVLEHWLRSAEQAGDTFGITQAALAIYPVDPDVGAEALRRARESLKYRIDCTSMGEFCRSVAATAPELVLEVAPEIPHHSEQVDALAQAAVYLYPRDPETALEIIRGLERAEDRSASLLAIVDGLLGTGDRARPQPLFDEL